MVFEIKTSIKINATPQQVWEVFSKFENYKNWNPFITSITGDMMVSKHLKVTVDGMKFKPKVLAFKINEKLIWKGKLFLPLVFDGTHEFLLVDHKDGTTTFYQNETFKGILIPFFSKKRRVEVKSGFENMNIKLKSLVEANQ